MLDFILRERAKASFLAMPPDFYHTGDIVAELDCIPSVDAVPVVRCKNYKHRPTDNSTIGSIGGMDIVFPDYECPCQCEDSYYNYYPGDDWFCPNGGRKEK